MPAALQPLAAAAVVALAAAGAAAAAEEAAETGRNAVSVLLPVHRDTVVSAAGGERDANLGGARRAKTKGIVELTLFDLPLERYRGAVIGSAVLRLRSAGGEPQRRVSVSTVAADWVEGGSSGYRPEPGGASFEWAAQGERRWAYPGSDVTAVINGRGNTIWAFADASPPDAEGWQEIALDPRVVAARLAGLSGGFALTDDVGHEYERREGAFVYHVFPNRFFWSREAGRESAPAVSIGLAGYDSQPPGAVDPLVAGDAAAARLPAGEGLVSWRTPADRGASGTLGFDVRWSRGGDFEWAAAAAVPRYLVPMAGEPGEPVELRLRDLEADPGAAVTVGVRAVDAAGNAGPVATARVELAPVPPPVRLAPPPPVGTEGAAPARVAAPGPAAAPPPEGQAAAGPARLGRAAVAVVDPLDKLLPESGRMVPPRPAGYLRANHLWSAARRTVRLFAAANEHVAFQVLIDGGTGPLRARLRFDGGERGATAPRPELHRLVTVPGDEEPLPDPLLPLGRGGVVGGGGPVALLAEVYVPHGARPGLHRGILELERDGGRLELAVELRVWAFTLPDHLSFVPQMNAYSLPPPPVDRRYYRLAHLHRTCLNLVPYSWRGEPRAGYAPAEGAAGWEWEAWDRRFGPLLDGSAFADLPRAGVPVDAFYLPLNENWPASIEAGFGGGYWAERALDAAYRRRFADAARRFAEHFVERRWTDTFFELYLNNKLYHRRHGWDRSSARWVFDEPINTQDFWALRWYGTAFHEGVAPVLRESPEPRPKLVFRADVSRPQWQRDLLDGVLDVNVVGVGFAPHLRAVMERKERWDEVVYNYGSSNRLERSNAQPAGWSVWCWASGGDGVLPWQTIGGERAWREATRLALFYPGRPGVDGEEGPWPSIRLKAYRRGQQDVEYLTLLAAASGRPRREIGEAVLELLGLRAATRQSGAEDAGTVELAGLDPAALWELRVRVGATLDRLAPPPRRRLVELRTPPRDPAALAGPPVLPPPQ